jgi:hypothetical protein
MRLLNKKTTLFSHDNKNNKKKLAFIFVNEKSLKFQQDLKKGKVASRVRKM